MSKKTHSDRSEGDFSGHPPASRNVPLYRRLPWTPIALSLLVLLAGTCAVDPVRDAATLGDVAEAYLERPLSYVLIAPLSNVLDTLTLLSVRQHVALFVAVVVLFAAWRVWRARSHPGIRSHVVASGALVGTIVVTYAAVAVLPRPMATLTVRNASILRVDFHSHTSASHDGRSGWSAEKSRAWHRAAGYDVAYVTDHASVQEAERGRADNPNPAAEGVSLLQGIEVTWSGEHVVILSAMQIYNGLLTPNNRDVDVQSLRLASVIPTREPVVIWNHPRELDRLPAAAGAGTPGVRAVEIVNGAPDGMDKIRPQRAQIIALAESRNLTLVAGSDNHGWGRTAPAWTLLRLETWRGMTADSVAGHIERIIREGGVRASRVVERRVADPGANGFLLAMTVIAAPARMLTTLSTDERVVWLGWIWLVAALTWWLRKRRSQPA